MLNCVFFSFLLYICGCEGFHRLRPCTKIAKNVMLGIPKKVEACGDCLLHISI